jgi:diaminopimelate decarboxylase
MKLDGFSMLDRELHCEAVPLSRIAAEVGTPTFVYSRAALLNRVRRLRAGLGETDCEIYFAVKACPNIHVLSALLEAGCGADIVSGGELFRATMAQIPAAKIVFSGVGKTEREIGEALAAGIHAFNVESLGELLAIDRLAQAQGATPTIALRVNPDVDAKTHPHISTGLKKNKFGLSKGELAEVYKVLGSLKAARVRGLSCHIGSQILSEKPFVKAWRALLDTASAAPFEVELLDLGGGVGIRYESEAEVSLENYGRLISRLFKNSPYKLGIEPGRAIVGPAAALLTRLSAVKKRGQRSFYVVDAAMNDLMRPALYGATHAVAPVAAARTRKLVTADVVGPVCESADTFLTGARLPEMTPGALLAFGHAGAYGMSMSSQYNSRPRAAEVLVDGSTYRVIRHRETYADLVQREL